jgi:hypothetical protein
LAAFVEGVAPRNPLKTLKIKKNILGEIIAPLIERAFASHWLPRRKLLSASI